MPRARMKPGVRPIVLPGAIMVPEHPSYWDVPANASASIALLVEDGQVEYEPAFSRSEGGQFAVPALQPVVPSAPRAPAPSGASKPFARKAPRN